MASNIANALLVMVIGMVVVFFGLVILIAFTKLMSWFLNRKNKTSEPVAVKVAEPEPVAIEEAPTAPAFEGIAPEIIAAISAALVAMEGSNKRLVVRSVKKVQGWGRAGRAESINY